MRCMALADSLARDGWQCSFAATAATHHTVPQLAGTSYQQIELEDNDWDSPNALMEGAGRPCNLLIIDHYGLDRNYETSCRALAEKILIIDDLANRSHDCDGLLDPASDDRALEYTALTPSDCTMLMGPKFAPLAQGFRAVRERALERRMNSPVERILVSFGSTDPTNLTVPALKTILDVAPEVEIDVVLGSSAPYLSKVRTIIDTMPATLHVETKDMARLMARADLAMGAAGVTAWERCCVGLPSIAIVSADNQRATAACLQKNGAAHVLDESRESVPGMFAEPLAALIENASERLTMSRRAAALCDGRGARRIELAFASLVSATDGAEVTLRSALHSDAEMMLTWQSHPQTRQFSRTAAVPDRDTHFRWVAARLSDPECLMNIILHAGCPAGVVRLDRMMKENNAVPRWEVSIYIAPNKYGLGLGLAALGLARRLVPEGEFMAEVLPENAASHALFRKAGYEWHDGLYWLAPVAE